MDWLEFSVSTGGEAAEAVIELFNRHGFGGAVVEVPVDCLEHELAEKAASPAQVIVRTYLALDGTSHELQRRLEEGLWHLSQILPIPEAAVRKLSEEDWAHAWKKQYHLLRVGRRLRIVPAWEDYDAEPGEVVIHLEPGMAFGTGLHPTTRLCLEALEEHTRPGCTVLDVGTGSGILAIAGAKLGARRVIALDIDPVAVGVARDNVSRNGVADRVCVELGSLTAGASHQWLSASSAREGSYAPLASGQFDLVVANILASVIADMAPDLAARLGPASRLIASGIIQTQVDDVTRALQKEGLAVIGRMHEEDWVALVAERGRS